MPSGDGGVRVKRPATINFSAALLTGDVRPEVAVSATGSSITRKALTRRAAARIVRNFVDPNHYYFKLRGAAGALKLTKMVIVSRIIGIK